MGQPILAPLCPGDSARLDCDRRRQNARVDPGLRDDLALVLAWVAPVLAIPAALAGVGAGIGISGILGAPHLGLGISGDATKRLEAVGSGSSSSLLPAYAFLPTGSHFTLFLLCVCRLSHSFWLPVWLVVPGWGHPPHRCP